MAQPPEPPQAAPWHLPAGWQVLDFISDLHLHAEDPATLHACAQYLASTRADAVFILGDLFEVWVGDDALLEPGSFEAACAAVLRRAAARCKLYFLHGNRDFLTGARFDALCATTTLPDPSVLDCAGPRLLLSHGDALCLQDSAYQQFRALVRSNAWQSAFLAQPLHERRRQARGMRAHSAQHQQAAYTDTDLDPAATRQWLHAAAARTLIHGHTHRPAEHDLGAGMRRIVLSDWDLRTRPARAQVLRWQRGQEALRRLPLAQVA